MMKAIIQRVAFAKVTVGDEVVSSIGRGLCVLVGISSNDNANDVEWIARKILNLRLFDEQTSGKRWTESVVDQQLEILCVSQFTLYHRLKGNRPDFSRAMQGPEAQQLYGSLLKQLREQYSAERIRDGRFGTMMQVHIQNDGPVTLEIESPEQSEQERQKLQRSLEHKAKSVGKPAREAMESDKVTESKHTKAQ
ncbi:D-aminoacyl-tRNA deacylase isoform X1 [Anopheles moucheti]|uniref:D-aminoacyl-tRNA deacylase isoform X1 n=1 Tax=Anopheles moucheti TaxID=186751 RepID=UPI0022F11D36|nr:D-aminoacyl-tRNA deacylase isoform X1 [Anopheles moucheti]